ncbi:MAG: glycogen synthase, partial [Deltaproteobacteria bacterium]|nr:glycogen synthase [Deltaproteobacteria bacterium]
MPEKLKVLFVASEGVPFAKTGGLADVVGTLPFALQELGVEVKVLMPYYGAVKQGKLPTVRVAENLEVALPDPLNQTFDLMAPESPDYPFWFVGRDEFYERSQLYGTPRGDYFDNLERFAFFSAAVLPVCRAMEFKPDLIHCHDWQSSLVPVYLKNHWVWEDLRAAKTVLTIHNLAYQGLFPRGQFPRLGLDRSLFNMDGLEFYDQINLLKGGMVFSDAITTVSRRYSQEIQTAEFGCGLEGVLRKRAANLHGILNGVDYREWSPESDKLLPANFSPADLKGKAADKAALMEAFGLNKKLAKAPILAIISRLADQKGFDLVAQVLPQLMTQDLMVVILGTGDEKYHRWLAAEAPKYKGKLGVLVAFDNKLAHLIEAGADMFLMP